MKTIMTLIYKTIKTISIISIILLLSCKNNDVDPVQYTGIVADGYLHNVKVCLDVNENRICDENESFTITDQGKYQLVATTREEQNATILAIVTEESTDLDEPDRVLSPYKLTSPAGRGDFISPLTTLVKYVQESNSYLTAEYAEDYLLDRLGFRRTDGVSLFEDYMLLQTTETEKAEYYKKLQIISKITARIYESFYKSLSETVSQSDVDIDGLDELFYWEINNRIVREFSYSISDILSRYEREDSEYFFYRSFNINSPAAIYRIVEQKKETIDYHVPNKTYTNIREVLSHGIYLFTDNEVFDEFFSESTVFNYRKIIFGESLEKTTYQWDDENKLWFEMTESTESTDKIDRQECAYLFGFKKEFDEIYRCDPVISNENFTSDGKLEFRELDNATPTLTRRAVEIPLKNMTIAFLIDSTDFHVIEDDAWFTNIRWDAVFSEGAKGYLLPSFNKHNELIVATEHLSDIIFFNETAKNDVLNCFKGGTGNCLVGAIINNGVDEIYKINYKMQTLSLNEFYNKNVTFRYEYKEEEKEISILLTGSGLFDGLITYEDGSTQKCYWDFRNTGISIDFVNKNGHLEYWSIRKSTENDSTFYLRFDKTIQPSTNSSSDITSNYLAVFAERIKEN